LETPEFIEATLSADGRTFGDPVKVIPQWKADCMQIPLKDTARYISVSNSLKLRKTRPGLMKSGFWES